MPVKQLLSKNCGKIDPQNIEDFLKAKGFRSLEQARGSMTPEQVIEEVKNSGLRGRGGAGFPCGAKWELAAKTKARNKYLICNADEGEVGTFKDRYLIENDPFTLIEGMAIAAYAIGAAKAFIYLRAEYRYLKDLLAGAIAQSERKGYLQGLDIEIREGAGAYICGEESALMNSIEGKRGEARFKPPFPPTSGLFGEPTIINNVETLANLPLILGKGAAWYQKLGTGQSKGTKFFCVSGDVARPGVYELEMGSSLRELVEDLAGARDIKLVQVGGSTGRVIPADQLDTPLAYESVLGSGAVMVLNQSRDVVEFVYRTMEFLNEESCGRCAPCREGTGVMVEILGRLAAGQGSPGDLRALEDLSQAMMLTALCGLGQAAPLPVLDTLKHFRSEYENRVGQAVFIRSLKALVA